MVSMMSWLQMELWLLAFDHIKFVLKLMNLYTLGINGAIIEKCHDILLWLNEDNCEAHEREYGKLMVHVQGDKCSTEMWRSLYFLRHIHTLV